MNAFDDRVRRLMLDVSDDDEARIAPPLAVWDAIEREVGIDPGDADSGPATEAGTDDAAVVQLHARRRRLTSLTLAAAAVAIVVIGAAVIIDRDGTTDVIATVAVSSDGLDNAPQGLTTNAVIEETNGTRRVELDAAAVEVGDDEFLELWLINDDISDMVSLGVVRPGASYEIPDGVVLADFPIIDVSVEPDDGVPTHSGRSVLRGRLDA